MKKHFNNKPVFIIDSATFDLEQTDALMGLFELQNQGAVTDLLNLDAISRLRDCFGSFSFEGATVESLHVFADDSMSAFDLADPEFLQLIYDAVASFDVEIYFG